MEDALLASWSANAALWTRAVREGRIASRRQVTDAAILAAVRAVRPRRLLDVGCGEGWLCRALADTGAVLTGVDASPQLVAAANAQGGGDFHTLSYAALAGGSDAAGSAFDTIVCNFSLLDDAVDALLAGLARIAARDATLLIQTIHPFTAGAPYADGWRTEHFESFGEAGWRPMPWFFRTSDSWGAVISQHWTLRAMAEPRARGAEAPASLLLTATPRAG